MTDKRRSLPEPRIDGPMSLEAAIAQRRSVRLFASPDLTLEQIGQLLWSAQGITGKDESERAAPSAGARHPLVFYVCRSDGVWRYHPRGHYITQHLEQDVRKELAKATWRQDFIAEAPCVFAISATFEQTTEQHQEGSRLRNVAMDVGHAAENLLLQAVALKLGSTAISALDESAISQVLALPEEEEPMYLIVAGNPGSE